MSSDNLVATVDENGLVTGRFSGTVMISATIEGRSGSATLSLSGPSQESLGGGDVSLLIPEGAIPSPLAFTATTTTAGPTSDLLVVGSTYDIGPSGTVFAIPITLTLAYDPVDVPSDVAESELRLFKVIGGEWVLMPDGSVDTVEHTVSGSITSLSRFGVRGLSVATIDLTPSSATLELGGSVQFFATPRTSGGQALTSRPVHWSSSDEDVATVDGSGRVSTHAPGTATITAASGGRTAGVSVTVRPPVASVGISPASTTLVVTETRQLTATAKDANGGTIEGKTTSWSSDDQSIVTVSSTGVVTGIRVGLTTVTGTIDGLSGNSVITVSESLGVTTNSLPSGLVGSFYSQTLSAYGGDGSFVWVVSTGVLPAGLVLASATGRISGTPTSAGVSNFTVTVVSGGAVATKDLSISVGSGLTVATNSLSGGVVGLAYSETLTSAGGTGENNWTVISGALPAGLSLNISTGEVSGTPSGAGEFPFTVQVSSGGLIATKELSISITSGSVSVATTSLPNGQVGSPYMGSLSATGGDGSYSWSISAGSLPDGLSIAGTGIISGTPVSVGMSSFMVHVTSNGQSATKDLSLTVTDGSALSVATKSLPEGSVGVAYSWVLTATGGDGSYNWMIYSGALPSGLALNASTGEISGTPTASGKVTFTVQVTSGDEAATASFSIWARSSAPWVRETLPGGTYDTWAFWGTGPSNLYASSSRGVLHFDGSNWSPENTPENAYNLVTISGSSSTDIWSVSGPGILHYDGTTWGWEETIPEGNYHTIWGPSATEVYAAGAVGDNLGLIARYNGSIWTKEAVPDKVTAVRAIHGAGGRVFALAGRVASPPGTPDDPYTAILERVDGTWQEYEGHPIVNVVAGSLWMMSATLAVAPDGSGMAVFDGTSWSSGPRFPSGFQAEGGPQAIWGTSLTHIYFVGQTCVNNDCDPTILFYNGSTFEDQTPPGVPDNGPLHGVWGLPDGSAVYFGGVGELVDGVYQGLIYRKPGG